MATYLEKLRDPRWQRKRLEVMQRADFACEHCESKDKTLNVHHKLYRKGADPWDYELDQLLCLCENCHESWHEIKTRIERALAGMDGSGLEQVAGYAEALLAFQYQEGVQRLAVKSYYDAAGISDAISYRPNGPEEIIDRSWEGYIDSVKIQEIYALRREGKN